MKTIDEINNLLLSYVNSNDKDINLIDISFDSIHKEEIENHICVFKELNWKEASAIDYNSFKNKNTHFSSENEKREIIKKSLLKIYDSNNNEIDFIYENLSYDFLEKYWKIYQSYLHLSLSEINQIYESSKKYFDIKNNEIFPVHPLIIQVDYMTKGIVHYSKTEFENLTVREFEAIQIILSAKNEI